MAGGCAPALPTCPRPGTGGSALLHMGTGRDASELLSELGEGPREGFPMVLPPLCTRAARMCPQPGTAALDPNGSTGANQHLSASCTQGCTPACIKPVHTPTCTHTPTHTGRGCPPPAISLQVGSAREAAAAPCTLASHSHVCLAVCVSAHR